MSRGDTRNIRREVLPNGLRILTEVMQHVRSVSVGIWINTGSRREPPEHNGICHFIEHMLFKGTTHRTAEQIARSVDSIGGHLDAFTAKECVCFNTKVLDEHLPVAFDVLSDLLLNPLFREDDIVRERGVVLEELKMDEDNADYLVHEIFTQNFWKDHPLGKPILGTKESVRRLDQKTLWDYFRRYYVPNRMVISAAGNLEHQAVVDLVSRYYAGLGSSTDELPDVAPQPHSRITLRNKKDLEQVHLCLGVPSYPLPHERRYGCYLLNTVLGGGMSSRLFQNIREKQGLAYAVFSELNPYRDTGCLSVYAGTSAEAALKVVELIMKEFRDLKANAVPPEELRRAKDHLKGSLMLSLESTTARMSNLARQEMYFGKFFSLDEIAARIERVTPEEVAEIANEFFRTNQVAVTALGNLDGMKLGREQLDC
ncbi:MAG: pitrilysin family protein [Acidobacteria bacterium]|jgi:predicted Zn-dependent peptidase|nr:pitrilysin family protein [Acidobacteriota bacterium]